MVSMLSACSDVDLRQKRIDNPRRPDSVGAAVGTMRLLAVRVIAPEDAVHVEGDSVGLFLTLANDGQRSDTLTSVTAPAAESVVLRVGATERKEGINIEVLPGGVASLQYPGGPHFELVELKHDVGRGSFLPVTFHFQRAGDVEVNVFVQAFDRPIVTPVEALRPGGPAG
jgi:copper(I)-binding protein